MRVSSFGVVTLTVGLLSGLFVGLLVWLLVGLGYYGLLWGLSHGLLFGVISTVIDVRPAERLRFALVGIAARVRAAVRLCLLSGLLAGVIYALLMADRLSDGLVVGLVVGLAGGLSRLLFVETAEIRTSANQGTRRSVKVALATTLFAWLLGAVIYPLVAEITDKLVLGLPLLGIIAGAFVGGLFAFRHFAIRLILWITGKVPLNYVRFLDYAAERLILRKVGGGYIFIHRMVLDYLAAQADQRERVGRAAF